ncbi:MAG: cytochrome c [Pseudolabrys sp.]|jgi:mono/diheme cytochrome c family protein
MTGRFAALFLSVALIALAGAPAVAADANNGGVLAKRWCAACHVVAADQQQANGQAPPFSAIGKTPDLDPSKLALFLLLPHPKMPDMALSRSEAADLAAYIQRQGK